MGLMCYFFSLVICKYDILSLFLTGNAEDNYIPRTFLLPETATLTQVQDTGHSDKQR